MSAEKNDINEVEKVIQNVRASWWEDGLVEVMSGSIFVFMAAFFCMIEFLPDTNLKKGLEIGFYAVLIIFAISSNWFKRYFKEKFIWTETGYSQPQMSRKSKIVLFLVFVLIVVNIVLASLWQLYQNSVFSLNLPNFFAVLRSYQEGLFIGLCIFLVYLSVYLSINKKRFLIAGVLGLCSGIFAELILTTFNLDYSRIIAATILGTIGIFSLFTGIPRFGRFRKTGKEV